MARTALPTSFGSSSTDPALWLSNWKGQHFDGMNFSQPVLSTAHPEQQFAQPGGGASVILPDKSVVSDEMSNQLVGNSLDELALTGAMGAKTLGLQAKLLGAKDKYEFAKELAEERKKAQEKKSSGGLFGSIGSVAGGILGTVVSGGNPVGGAIGSKAGGFLGGLFG
jgi:hypothetical protein